MHTGYRPWKALVGLALAAVMLQAPDLVGREQLWAGPSDAAPPASSVAGRARATFSGEVRAGQSFERPFGPGLLFRLEPDRLGWTITVREKGRDEDLSRLTPPFHFVPNPRDIEGWHFRNSDNTGPNEAGDRNVNAPGEVREFIFSPEVGRSFAGPQARTAPSPEDIDNVRRFGQGTLKILEYRLNNLEPGKQAGMEWMRFAVEVSWPQGYSQS